MLKKVHENSRTILKRINQTRRERPVVFWLRVAVLAAIALFFIVQRNFWTPDTLFALLFIIFLTLGQARVFIVRFAPFILLLLAYDSFRGIADDLNTYVNFWPMISFDQNVFGVLPTETLQNWWWHGRVQWYDVYFYFLYTLHFVMPVALAVLIWKLMPKMYWEFVVALVGLSFMAFITYVVFPAAPPWMASDLGYIDPIHRISSDIWYAMGVTNFSQFYAELSPNPVAAVPSLHSAYPLLFVLYLWRLFSIKKTWWLLVYPVSIWIGVVYLGEHYVVDALLGALYAIGAYYGAKYYFTRWRRYEPTYMQDYARGYAAAHTRVTNHKRR
jgi:hypothetical protein